MMNHNTIKMCMFVLFLHSLQCTPTDYITPDFDVDAVAFKKAMKGFGSDKAAIVDSVVKRSIDQKQEIRKAFKSHYGKVNKILTKFLTPDSDADAVAFMKAMKGFGSDKAAIVNLVVKRSNDQRQKIRKAFKSRYGKDLIDELKSELTGELETAVVGLMLTNHQFYANELHDALAGFGTDDKALAEILGSLNRTEIQDIANVYQKEYGTKLKDDIVDDTSESFQKLLVQLCNTDREYYEGVDDKNATQDSRNLILAIFGSQQENKDKMEEILISILTTRSYPQLKKIFEEFAKIKKKDIMESIKGRFSDSLEYGLFTIIRRANSKNDYYAHQLNDAMEGIGTNERQLIRIIVGRSEIDLNEIKESYKTIFVSSLIDQVAVETSGYYKNLLTAILRK